jgi:hypothetical protein
MSYKNGIVLGKSLVLGTLQVAGRGGVAYVGDSVGMCAPRSSC